MLVPRKASAPAGGRYVPFVCVAVLGGLAGFSVIPPRAHACSCAESGWDVERKAVWSTSGAHDALWPAAGRLHASSGSTELVGQYSSAGVIYYVRAEEP